MNIKIIKDPVTGKQYSRDLDIAGSTFQAYTAPAVSPATNLNTGKTNEQVLAESTTAAQKAQQVAGLPSSAYTPPAIPTPTPTPNLDTIGATAPVLPIPTAPVVTDNYYNSLNTQLADTQKVLKELQDRQLAETQAQKAATQQQLDELRILQENNIVAQGSSALTEKQQKLDLLAEEKARFDENYKSVQGLVGQLTSLVSQGQHIIGQQKELAIPQVFRSQKINQTLSDISAQTGVIQAAISAYSGNMSQAQSQLTNATNVITSAYNDEMDYYKTLNTFYESKTADTNQKLITITKDERDYINNQIATLESDKKNIEDNLQKLKDIFLDPDKALKFAKAGITITTPQSEWGKKLADQSYAEEIQKTSQDMANSGYSYLIEGQTAPSGTTTQTITDSRGNQKTWYKKESTTTDTTEKPLTPSEIAQYQFDFPDARITIGDTRATAEAKAHPQLSNQPVNFAGTTFNGLTATLPGGGTLTFPNQQALDQFKKDNGFVVESQTQNPPTNNQPTIVNKPQSNLSSKLKEIKEADLSGLSDIFGKLFGQ